LQIAALPPTDLTRTWFGPDLVSHDCDKSDPEIQSSTHHYSQNRRGSNAQDLHVLSHPVPSPVVPRKASSICSIEKLYFFRGEFLELNCFRGEFLEVNYFKGEFLEVNLFRGEFLEVNYFRAEFLEVNYFRGEFINLEHIYI
jgi:hypothetical protein